MSVIRQVVELGPQWPGIDPFLFSMHHRDAYPAAKGTTMTPDASLEGRDLGQDFSGKDGWSMYHGQSVPGFPQHPHRGFETVTVVLEGAVDHVDSAGASARYADGDTQWLTAGSGVAHSEMFPLRDAEGPNPLELFQIWLNLAPEDKTADANFEMFWAEETPIVTRTDEEGRTTRVRLVAGKLDGVTALTPPPRSWAARPENDLAIWVIDMAPGATTVLPAASSQAVRVLYTFEGAVTIEDQTLSDQAAVLDTDQGVRLSAGAEGARMLMLQGRPIGAPVVQHGPFVGNSRDDIAKAFDDYQRGEFGRWTNPDNAPVNAHDAGRFARYPDGTLRTPPTA
ncbi:pirin family protein [Granulicoccus phenolivorans]|uniref:pirin family protein n=1 Tax=Granulicoccus phenolivorans TaxID=266854 RepID=UPI00040FD86C|nr:pirin family protein [Granulicoccus phenolivorans]